LIEAKAEAKAKNMKFTVSIWDKGKLLNGHCENKGVNNNIFVSII